MKNMQIIYREKNRKNRGKNRIADRIKETGEYEFYDETIVGYYGSLKEIIDGFSNIIAFFEISKRLTSTGSKVLPNKCNESISFSGGGYTCAYHLGVLKYIFENNEIFKNTICLGASGGAGSQ